MIGNLVVKTITHFLCLHNCSAIFTKHFNTKKQICSIYNFIIEAGFTQEWAESHVERASSRQIEVQASNGQNANRSTEYRTTTAANRPTSTFEAQERMF